jgi:hypothetical protein
VCKHDQNKVFFKLDFDTPGNTNKKPSLKYHS